MPLGNRKSSSIALICFIMVIISAVLTRACFRLNVKAILRGIILLKLHVISSISIFRQLKPLADVSSKWQIVLVICSLQGVWGIC